MSSIELSKFDVAERQLLQAIKLFFQEEDPVSIHTLSEAANQVFSDIGGEFGAISFIRNSDLIKKNKKKEWLRYMFKSRNFFKHANSDKDAIHKFKSEFNDFSLLDGINMYSTIKKKWTPETLAFQIWFGATYPNLLKEENVFNQFLLNSIDSGRIANPKDKSMICNIIQSFRNGSYSLDNICIEYGL